MVAPRILSHFIPLHDHTGYSLRVHTSTHGGDRAMTNQAHRLPVSRRVARLGVASLAAAASLMFLSGVAAAQYGGLPEPTTTTTTTPQDTETPGTVEPEPTETEAPASVEQPASRGAQRSALAFTGADVLGLAAMGAAAAGAGGGLLAVSRRRRQGR